MHLYRNLFKLPRLVGLLAFFLSLLGGLYWEQFLFDHTVDAFDSVGIVTLVLVIILLLFSTLLLCGVRWIRLALSFYLHGLIILSLGVLIFGLLMEAPEMIDLIRGVVGCFLVIGLSLWMILMLHNQSFQQHLTEIDSVTKTRRRLRQGICFMGSILFSLVVFMLPFVSALPVLWGQPNPSIDYLTLANTALEPNNTDPNLNAASNYIELFQAFHPLPESLSSQWDTWPDAFDPNELMILEEWVKINESVLTHLKEATDKPYFWIPYQSSSGALCEIEVDHLTQLRQCTHGIFLIVLWKARHGQVEEAFELLKCLLRMGIHQNQRGTLLEQLVGLAVCKVSGKGVLVVLDHIEVDLHEMVKMQQLIQTQVPLLTAPQFLQIEKLYGHDNIQRVFTDDGYGNGRLIPSKFYDMTKDGSLYHSPLSFMEAFCISLSHPDRVETTELFDLYYDIAQDLATKSPWQLYSENSSYDDELEWILMDNAYLERSFRSISRVIELGWRSRMYLTAVETSLALHRYRAQHDSFPPSLQELVAQDFLECLPQDIYSNKPLVYRMNEDHFVLYSIGSDFADNGGAESNWGDNDFGGDKVFWPIDAPVLDKAVVADTPLSSI